MSEVRCKRCGKPVPAGEVQYVSADVFYCKACFLAHKGSARGQDSRSARQFDASPVDKQSLVCAKCGFTTKFRGDSSAPRVCSYCGHDVFRQPEDTAPQLIADADDFDTDE